MNMDAVNIVLHYHERTKHHPHRYARSPGYLDWETQPNPFRRFNGSEMVPLILDGDPGETPYASLYDADPAPPQPLNRRNLSALFEFALGLSAWKSYRGSSWALRMNPSSGNLHPTEGYVALPAVPGLTSLPGVFHYAPKEHALERRCTMDSPAWQRLVNERLPGQANRWPFFVGLSSIHWREAWKYGERAYRYCQHDVGHALAALAFSAKLLGWILHPIHDLGDRAIASLLGLDRAADFEGAEGEHPDLLVAVLAEAPSGPSALRGTPVDGAVSAPQHGTGILESTTPDDSPGIRALASGRWTGQANQLSPHRVEWDIIERVAQACRKPEGAPAGCESHFAQSRSNSPHAGYGSEFEAIGPNTPPPRDVPLALSGTPGGKGDPAPAAGATALTARQILRRRRSAVDMDGQSAMPRATFLGLLARTRPHWNAAPWNALGPPACVHLVLFVHRVIGLEPGIYALVRESDTEPALRAAISDEFSWNEVLDAPRGLPLFQLLAGDCRAFARHASCDQAIASHGVFSCAMLAEFEPRLTHGGPWFYRRLFWETGVIGQVLYLEAEAAGLRGTGIGCFFDDVVHQALGLHGRSFQSLYHFTIGGPVEDSRLTTLPPYGDDVRSREDPGGG